MSTLMKLVACGMTVLCLSACNSDNAGTTGANGDAFIERMKTLVATAPNDAEPANADGVTATRSDHAEPVAIP